VSPNVASQAVSPNVASQAVSPNVASQAASPNVASQTEPESAPVEETPPAPVEEEAPVQTTAALDTAATTKEPVPQPEPQPEPQPAVAATTVAPVREQEAPVDREAPAQIPERVRQGWLSVTADEGTEVYVAGRYRGDASPRLELELPSGPHRIECRKPGYVTYRETVYITPGELSNRRIVLKKLQGWLSLSTMVGAEVYVDGKLVGITPLGKSLKLDTGTHLVTVKKAGFNVWNNEITVRADETLPLKIILSPIY